MNELTSTVLRHTKEWNKINNVIYMVKKDAAGSIFVLTLALSKGKEK